MGEDDKSLDELNETSDELAKDSEALKDYSKELKETVSDVRRKVDDIEEVDIKPTDFKPGFSRERKGEGAGKDEDG